MPTLRRRQVPAPVGVAVFRGWGRVSRREVVMIQISQAKKGKKK
jgi:hypothetical protein